MSIKDLSSEFRTHDLQTRAHALVLPYPAQGHINPMLQFAKRLAHHGLRTTLAVPKSVLGSSKPELGPVHVATISDGFDETGVYGASSVTEYLNQLKLVGSKSLEQLMQTESAAGRPINVIIYDTLVPWGADVARQVGAATVAFFTQSCAVNMLYGQVSEGKHEVPVPAGTVQLTGLPVLDQDDLPTFVVEPGSYPAYVELFTKQFESLDKADEVLIPSFYELETEETKYMASVWRGKTIGPTVPSSYLDNLIPDDTSYGFHLLKPDTPSLAWLDSNPPNSVVYISIGSLSSLSPIQMAELAYGLFNSNIPFLWVVRSTETSKLPEGFIDEAKERGLVITWSPQLDVLAHCAVGCFLTHCGWNSTVEALSLGVPMVAFPQWTDQPMNAKYIESVWKVGVRTRRDSAGLVSREEVERCVKEVMQGERSEEYRRNAQKWSNMAHEAMKEGGSSYRNIVEFVARCSKK